MRYRLGALAVLAVAVIVVTVFIGVPDVAELRRHFAGAGLLGALGFALVYAALSLLPLPASVITVAAGAMFGLARGLPVVILGATLGAMVAFYLGRVLGRDAVQRFTGARLQAVSRYLERRGFWAVLVARLVPIVPFSALNYLSGLTAVRPLSYLIATILGIVPGSTVYVAVGAYGNQPGSMPFLTALGALTLLTAVGVVIARRRRRGAADERSGTTTASGQHTPAPQPSSGTAG